MGTTELKDKTAKGLLWGGLSNGLQQLLNLIFGIALGRILTPADYGMVGMLTIFSLLASSLQESGFIAAIVNKKEVTHRDYNAVFWFNIMASSAIYLILFFCAPLIAKFYDVPELTPLARYSFLGFVISSTGISQTAYLARNLKVKQRAIASMTGLLISGICGVTLALCGMAYWGIATQSLVYILCNTVLLWHFSSWRPSMQINLSPLKGMFGFSCRMLATNMFTHINNNILSVILGKFYNVREVGFFNQANKWTSMGYFAIYNMVSGVAQPVLAQCGDDTARQRNVFRKMLRFTSFVAFPAMFGLSLIAPELILIALTDKWEQSAQIMRVLCIGGAFTAVSSVYSHLIISKGKSNIYMWITIALGVTQATTMICCSRLGINTLVDFYVCINIAWLAIWQFFVWRETGFKVLHALGDILPFAFIAAGTMLLTAYCTREITMPVVLLLAKIVIAATIYVLALWICRAKILMESVQFIREKYLNKRK